MSGQSTLIRCEEAQQFLDRLPDPITKNLVNMSYVLTIKKCLLERSYSPEGEFDMLFFVRTLSDLFSERGVILKALAGEKVGSWFDDDSME